MAAGEPAVYIHTGCAASASGSIAAAGYAKPKIKRRPMGGLILKVTAAMV
jgi:hypothetical protein